MRVGLIVSLVLSGLSAQTRPALASSGEATCAPNSGSGSISGTVTTSAAVPANFVEVTAYTEYGDYAGGAYTDASGFYQIAHLIGGNYILKYRPTAGTDAAMWSGSQASPTTATVITLVTGGAASGINAQLLPGGRIRGRVTDSGGTGLENIYVSIVDSTGATLNATYSDATGLYTSTVGLQSGVYWVRFDSHDAYLDVFFGGGSARETATPVTVTAPASTDHINQQLTLGGAITGTVTDTATGLPVSGAYVSAYGDIGSDYDYTDSSGSYGLSGLGSGAYTVRVSASGGLMSTPQTVIVTAPAVTPGINLSLAPGGTLSGRVTWPGGIPLNGITVYVGNLHGLYGDYVTTNSSGVYTATGLPTGDNYYVFFRPSSTYVPEMYDDHTGGEGRELISITAPGAVTGIDAELALGSSVAGTVTDGATGSPIPDVFVEILDLNGGRVESANTASDGTYQTPDTLAPGSYKVIFNADERFASCTYVSEYYAGDPDLATAAAVDIGSGATVTGIDASLDRGSIVFGRVTDAGTGAPITSGTVSFKDGTGLTIEYGRLTFLGGYHSVTGLRSGSYTVFFQDYGTSYVDEYYDNHVTRAAADPLVVTAPTDVVGIDAQLARGSQISGVITEARTGLPFFSGYVQVIDAGGAEVGYGEVNPDGSYTVYDGLPTGSYSVVFVPQSEFDSGGSYIPSFYRAGVAPGATLSVVVTAPAKTTGINIAVLNGAFLPQLRR